MDADCDAAGYDRACGEVDRVLGGWADFYELRLRAKALLRDAGKRREFESAMLLAGSDGGRVPRSLPALVDDPTFCWVVVELSWTLTGAQLAAADFAALAEAARVKAPA